MRSLFCAVVVALMLPVVPAAARPAAATAPAEKPGRLIVGFEPWAGPRSVRAAHASAGAGVRTQLARLDVDIVEVDDVGRGLAAYRQRPGVRFVELDRPVHALDAPDDADYAGLQWNLQPASAENRGTANWEPLYTPGAENDLGAGIRVAIIDSGLNAGGDDTPLHVNMNLAKDYVDGGDPDDPSGHGTHIAGTIAQATANGAQVAGVAPAAEIIPIRVLDKEGSGAVGNVMAALLYAVDNGARVVNLSLGGEGFSPGMCSAVQAVADRALVIAATGNDSSAARVRPLTFPAACPGAFAVSGARYDGTRAPYSNAGCQVALTAPGGDARQNQFNPDDSNADLIFQESSLPGKAGDFDLVGADGTSSAAAHVAGAAAILMAEGADVHRTRQLLKASARDLGAGGPDDVFGYGALDIARAVAMRGAGPVTLADRGYWLAAADGGIFNYGSCFLGSTGATALNEPIVGVAPTRTGAGYWLVASDGGIFSFGDAPFFGSTGAIALNEPIVGMAPTPSGKGYWLVASDGGIFSFGDAPFYGSTGAIALNQPIAGVAPTPAGTGYWMVATDGGIFSFGDAGFYGSTGAIALNQPIVGMAPSASGQGYSMVAADGGIFTFGDAVFRGSAGAVPLNQPIVGMAVTRG